MVSMKIDDNSAISRLCQIAKDQRTLRSM